jgi:hypothetical protein
MNRYVALCCFFMPPFIFMRKCWAEKSNYTLPGGYASNLTLPGNSGNHRRIRKVTHSTCSNGCLKRHHNLFPFLAATLLLAPHAVGGVLVSRRKWLNAKCVDPRFRLKYWNDLRVNGAEMCGIDDYGCIWLYRLLVKGKCSIRTVYRIRIPDLLPCSLCDMEPESAVK